MTPYLLELTNKSFPAMWGTWVQSLGWEDPLEKGKATCSSILAWRIPWKVAKSRTLSDFHFHFSVIYVVTFISAPSPLAPEPSSRVLRKHKARNS